MKSISKADLRKLTQPVSRGEFLHLLFAVLLGLIAIGMVMLAAWVIDEPPSVFTREPQQVLDGSFYVGSFSNFGGVIWFATAAILSFAAVIKRSERGALIAAALLTWAMGLDDIFMLHDRVYPKLFLSELMVYSIYYLTIALITLRFFRQLDRSTLVGIVVGAGFWVLSAALDRFFNVGSGQLAEDSMKFIGLSVWAAAWIRQSYTDIIRLTRSKTD